MNISGLHNLQNFIDINLEDKNIAELQQECFALFYALKELLRISVDTLQEADWMIAKLLHKYYNGEVKLDTLYIRLMRFKFSIHTHNIQFYKASLCAIKDVTHLKVLILSRKHRQCFEILKDQNVTPVNICMFCASDKQDCINCYHLSQIHNDVDLIVVDEKTNKPAIKINNQLANPLPTINLKSTKNDNDVTDYISLAIERKVEIIKSKLCPAKKSKNQRSAA